MIPHLRFPAVTFAALAAELDRELAQRRRFYPGRVAKGNMSEGDAARETALAEAWRADLARALRCWQAGIPLEGAAHSFTWRDRVQGLRREIGLRERFYPEWIKTGRLSEADAAVQLAALRCWLAIYDDGFDWRSAQGERPNFHRVSGVTPEIAQAREEWAAHAAAIDAERRAHQQELELDE